LPASEYGEGRPPEVRSASETPAGQGAARAIAPLALCIGAGLALASIPVLVWHLKTGDWICLSDWFSLYYLRFAAQAYYNHILYIADVVVPGGVTTYPWLRFVPATYAARAFGAGPFAVNLIWTFLSAIGLSAGLYFVFGVSSNRPGWRPDARCSASRTTASPPRVRSRLSFKCSRQRFGFIPGAWL